MNQYYQACRVEYVDMTESFVLGIISVLQHNQLDQRMQHHPISFFFRHFFFISFIRKTKISA
jgi:hypothetical protein